MILKINNEIFDNQKKMSKLMKWINKAPLDLNVEFNSCEFTNLKLKSGRSVVEDDLIDWMRSWK